MVKKKEEPNTDSTTVLSRRSVLSLTSAGVFAAVGGERITSKITGQATATEQASDLTVGAHYYTWYGRGTHVDWLNETPEDPTLGPYDARDPAVIKKHLEWCRTYGIDWLSMSWWGQNSPEDVTIRDHILAQSLEDIKFSIFYETPGMLTAADDGTYNLDSSQNRDQLVSDVNYLAETYFTEPQYRRIDGRPVLYLYISGTFRGDIAAAFDAMRAASPDGLYIIADLIRFGPPLDKDKPIIDAADAVTSYNMYAPLDDINQDFVARATDVYDEWVDPLASTNTEFIPVAIPGYDDTELEHVSRDNPPLDASPELLRDFCREAKPYATDGASSFFITSFNEWYENTQVEPSGSFGTEYLEVIQDEFGTSSGDEPVEITLQFDRTVSEDELADGIENPRELAVQSFGIDVTDGSGRTVADYDIGIESDEPEFGSGAYGPEQLSDTSTEDSSWRWFGGDAAETTIYLDSSFSDARSLVLRGGAAEGAIGVTVRRDGVVTDELTVDGRTPDDYQFSLSRPDPAETEIEFQFGRTVSEDELADGIENPRELAARGFELDILDSGENQIATYDIGIEGNEPEFGIGAYLPAQLSDTSTKDSSWRWFGGSRARTTIYLDGTFDDAESLLFRGGSAEGAVDLTVLRDGTVTDELRIDGRSPDDYQISFAEPVDSVVVTSGETTDVTATAGTLNGSVTDLGTADSALCRFRWRKQGKESWNRSSEQTVSTPEAFAADISGLASGTAYEYQAVAEASNGSSGTGDIVTFRTDISNVGPSIDSYSVSEAQSSDPHLAVSADWNVSDEDGNLDTVILQVLDSSGSIADARSIDVSGSKASASGMEGISVRYVDGEEFTVVLTVVDSHGRSARGTKTISE